MPTILPTAITWPMINARINDAAERGDLPKASVPILRSSLRAPLAEMVKSRLSDSGYEFDEVDLVPFLSRVPDFVHAKAKSAGNSRPGNAKSRVMQVLDAALPGFRTARVVGDERAARCGENWAPLFVGVKDGKQARIHRANLSLLAETAWGHGVDGPLGLPSTADEAAEVMRQWGISEEQIGKIVHAYRQAIEGLAKDGVVVRGAPDWSEHRRGRRRMRRIGGDRPEAELRDQLPKFSELLEAVRNAATGMSDGTRTNLENSLFRVASGVVGMYEAGKLDCADLHDFGPEDLFLRRQQSIRSPKQAKAPERGLMARLLGADEANVVMAAADKLPIAAVLGEWQVDHAKIRPWITPDSRFFYVNGSVGADIHNVWYLMRSFLLAHMSPQFKTVGAQARFDQIQAGAVEVQQHFARLYRRAHRPTAKDKQRAIRHFTLPIITNVVLPWWTLLELPRVHRAAESAFARQRKPRSGAEQSRSVRIARHRYLHALESWTMLAVVIADPLRRAQPVYGRLGAEYELDADWAPDGSLLSIRSFGSRFSGQGAADNPKAKLKQNDHPLREWTLSPSVLNHAWFGRFLTDFWLPTLIRTGLTAPTTTLREAVESGRFVLFPGTRGGDRKSGARGSGFSSRFADGMRRSLMALGYNIPKSGSRVAEGWALILGPHIVRLLWASYWLGLREHSPIRAKLRDGSFAEISGVTIAERATTDGERTLRRHYVSVSDELLALERAEVNTWRNPRVFDATMDQSYFTGVAVCWESVWSDPTFPLPPHLREAFERRNL